MSPSRPYSTHLSLVSAFDAAAQGTGYGTGYGTGHGFVTGYGTDLAPDAGHGTGYDDDAEYEYADEVDPPAEAAPTAFWTDAADGGQAAWRLDALCAETDPEAFLPEKGGSTREAKRVCLGCSVRTECLGVRAGQRRALRHLGRPVRAGAAPGAPGAPGPPQRLTRRRPRADTAAR